jgi:glycosyltransferase involved in cell wall biosynthesis
VVSSARVGVELADEQPRVARYQIAQSPLLRPSESVVLASSVSATATQPRIGKLPAVLISHPGKQHAYETALAAQEAGLIHSFVTAIYRTGKGLSNERLWNWAPHPIQAAIDRSFRRRCHEGLALDHVVTISSYHVLALALRKLSRRPERWADHRFDAAVARTLRETRPRIVHAFETGALYSFRAAKRLGLVTILDVPSAHEYYLRTVIEEGGTPFVQEEDRIKEERELADYLLVPSDYVANCLRDNGVPAAKLIKVPYGVDPSIFSPSPHRRDGQLFRVLYVGQIGHRKGVRYLLEAWRRIQVENSELVLVGPAGPSGKRILREFDGLFKWVGALPKHDLRDWYQRADVFVFPSLAEGSALVTYEAMASGLPLITTANSGSVMREGIDGIQVPSRDVDSLARAIRFLYQDRGAARRMGVEGRKHVSAQYTWRHYRERLRQTYEALLAGRIPKSGTIS